MRPNIAAMPFVPLSIKPKLQEGSSRRPPVRKVSGGKTAQLPFSESRYKTELCRQFEELKECEYGDRCLFAHSIYELKPLPFRHPKFRTERCLAFAEDGFCAFGPRCSFIHEKVDAEQVLKDILADVRKQLSPEEEPRLPVFQRLCPDAE